MKYQYREPNLGKWFDHILAAVLSEDKINKMKERRKTLEDKRRQDELEKWLQESW